MAETEEPEKEIYDNSKEGQKAAAALDSVTDHVVEKEISGASKFIFKTFYGTLSIDFFDFQIFIKTEIFIPRLKKLT